MAEMTQSRTRARALRWDDRRLTVVWHDGRETPYHHVWLRDGCTCAACGDPTFGSKTFLASELGAHVRPRRARLGDDGAIEVVWEPDGHASRYDSRWLRGHAYDPASRAERRRAWQPWTDARPRGARPTAFAAVIADDAVLFRLLHDVADVGLAFIAGCPGAGGIEAVADRIGYLRENNYGRAFDIRIDPGADNFSGLTQANLPHTDDGFRACPPGLLLLQCVVDAEGKGGTSIFLDGLALVESLRAEDPTAFDLLTRVPLTFRRLHPGEHDLRNDGRIIRLDVDGNVCGVRFATHNTAPPNLPEALVTPFYDALAKLVRLYRQEQRWLRRPLAPGDMAVIDNERVLHGRTGFTGASRRHLRGGGIERDAFHSRLRILAEKLGGDDPDALFPVGLGG